MFLFRLTKIFLAFYEGNDEKFPTMPTFAYTYLYLLHKKHFFCMLRVANQIVLFQSAVCQVDELFLQNQKLLSEMKIYAFARKNSLFWGSKQPVSFCKLVK